MKRKLNSMVLLLSFIAISVITHGQVHKIGHRQVTYTDPSRSNRSIQTELYYPATTAGDNVACAAGQFPIIVFGHGFVMAWSAYQNFWDTIVPRGYIMAFPRTEGNMSPNHEEFGKDLAFLITKLKSEGQTSTSFLYQKVATTSAIMGHSMGGGASFLASKNNTNITTMISFAAANTNPSSISAARQVTVPTLMFMGQNDGVTPPVEHQIPMYDSLASNCKTIISILGGGHCYFANDNFNCSFGEGTTSPQPTITRSEQHETTFNFLIPYLESKLKNNSAAESEFATKLFSSSLISFQRSCLTSSFNINGTLQYTNSALTKLQGVEIKAMNGTSVAGTATTDANGNFNITGLANGTYTIVASIIKPWGGVSSTDILKIKRHIAGLELLTESLKLKAADVNLSNTITSTDALKVQRRIAGLDLIFTSPDWIVEINGQQNMNVTINGANTTISLSAICSGDVNVSYTPTY